MNRAQPQPVFSLFVFVTSAEGSVCPKSDLLIISYDSKQSQADFTEVLPQQPTGNLFQFYDKVYECMSTLNNVMVY